MDSIDCFDRYRDELGWVFTRVMPTAEFKALLDLRLKLIDYEKSMVSRYGLDDFEDWVRSGPKIFPVPGTGMWSIENIYEYKLEYFLNKLGDTEDVQTYSRLVNEEKEMTQRLLRIADKSKNVDIPSGFPDKYYDISQEMVFLFDEIKNKHGITKEEFYVWLRSQGVKGLSVAGIYEIIPGLELYELEFLKERLGNTEEVTRFEELAMEYAALENMQTEQ